MKCVTLRTLAMALLVVIVVLATSLASAQEKKLGPKITMSGGFDRIRERQGVFQMIEKSLQKMLALGLSFILVIASSQILNGAQAPDTASTSGTGNPTEAAPQTASELQALVSRLAGDH